MHANGFRNWDFSQCLSDRGYKKSCCPKSGERECLKRDQWCNALYITGQLFIQSVCSFHLHTTFVFISPPSPIFPFPSYVLWYLSLHSIVHNACLYIVKCMLVVVVCVYWLHTQHCVAIYLYTKWGNKSLMLKISRFVRSYFVVMHCRTSKINSTSPSDGHTGESKPCPYTTVPMWCGM